MKNWIRRTLIALFGAGIVAGSLAACSSGPRESRHGDGDRAEWQGRLVDRVAERLALDAAQQARLQTLVAAMRAQRQAFMGGSGADPRAEVQGLVAGATFDKAGAQKLLDEKIAAVRGNSPAVLDAMADFYDSLNATQQQQVRDFMQKRRHGWRRHG